MNRTSPRCFVKEAEVTPHASVKAEGAEEGREGVISASEKESEALREMILASCSVSVAQWFLAP